jgi:hypothetical protein
MSDLIGRKEIPYSEYLDHVDKTIKKENLNYEKTSEQFVDRLLSNYKIFMHIGKNVEKIETNLIQTQCNIIIK